MARLWATLKQAAGSDDVGYPASNPLTREGRKVMTAMKKQYGSEKGERVFYATARKHKKNWEGR